MQDKTFYNIYTRQALLTLLASVALILSGCVLEASDASMIAQSSLLPIVKQTKANELANAIEGPRTCQTSSKKVSEIVIGALLPLTESPAMQAGLAMQLAIDIAVGDINQEGGVLALPMRVITYDTQGSPAIGAEMAEKLIIDDCVAAIVGIYHSRVGMAVKETAHQYGVPVIFAEPYNDAITSDLYPEVFRIAPTTQMTTKTYVDWLQSVGDHNHDQHQSIVMIADSSNFESSNGQNIAQQLEENKQASLEIFLADLPSDDFSSMIARIIALENTPDTILVWFNGDAGYAFHQQLIQAGIGPQNDTLIVLRHSTINSDLFWNRVPDGLNTVITKIGPWHSTVSEMGKTFAKAYSNHVDRWPESYAFESYDATRLIASAIEQAQSLDATEIIETLESIDVVLASGRYHFPYGSKNVPDDEEIPKFMWHQWPDPHILFLQYDAIEQSAMDMPVLWPELYRTIDTAAFYTVRN